jgi:Ulp1 family protease
MVAPKHINMYHIMQIFLPVLHQHHWSVYCVNFEQTRIDVLDPMHPTHECEKWDKHHSELGKKIIHRLSDALSNAAPHKFKSFKNWRHVPVKVPVHKNRSESAFFTMKFLEFYDGAGHGSLHTSIDVVSLPPIISFTKQTHLPLLCIIFLGSTKGTAS